MEFYRTEIQRLRISTKQVSDKYIELQYFKYVGGYGCFKIISSKTFTSFSNVVRLFVPIKSAAILF